MGWGDEIMVSGRARQAQRRDPRPVRVVNARGRVRWSAVWDHNPRFALPGSPAPAQTLMDAPGHRPYIARKSPQRWHWQDWICPVGEIHLSEAERGAGLAARGAVVIEPGLKDGASPNKDWGRARWAALTARLSGQGHDVVQLGAADAPALPGARRLSTAGFRDACAMLANARLAVLPEGGLHHAAAALGTPSIVLFGGFISPRQTGYAHQWNFFTGGEPCGWRRPCRHCAKAMAAIEVDAVAEAARALLAVVPPAGAATRGMA